MMRDGTVIVFGLLIVLMIVFAPLAIIWSLNTLFGLGIAYTFWTWLAVAILSSAFGKANISIKRS